jgi:DNA-binding SARP family transcriptional activator
VAELIVRNLYSLDDASMALIRDEAEARPERWRGALRVQAIDVKSASRLPAARLLDAMGSVEDVALLRSIGREQKQVGRDRTLGRALARRLAPRVVVEDLGRVTLKVGVEVIPGTTIRRKVLALLCYLLTRSQFSATREEVMEAMWPDMDPAAAINSLNQSVYFLRRVFEPEYSEETSAGYVHQDSDVLWLDNELIESKSSRCVLLLAEWDRTKTSAVARHLSNEYSGKFALDFSYEDWSVDFREWLHVAYLRSIETQIKDDIDTGDFDSGVSLTRRALEIDPRQEDLELSLLRLLRNAGAHSAAAEQYARYANVLRSDLGVEPPSLDTL